MLSFSLLVFFIPFSDLLAFFWNYLLHAITYLQTFFHLAVMIMSTQVSLVKDSMQFHHDWPGYINRCSIKPEYFYIWGWSFSNLMLLLSDFDKTLILCFWKPSIFPTSLFLSVVLPRSHTKWILVKNNCSVAVVQKLTMVYFKGLRSWFNYCLSFTS